MRPPQRLEIAQNLSTEASFQSVTISTATAMPNTAEAQALFDYANSTLKMGEEIVFTIDVPYVPLLDTPVAISQSINNSASYTGELSAAKAQKLDYILKDCQEISSISEPTSAERFVDPAGMLSNYLQNAHHRKIDDSSARVTLLNGPKHGKLDLVAGSSPAGYRYDPPQGFVGEDQAVFR